MPIQYRNISADARGARYGTIGEWWIEPDGLLTVVDEAAESYDHQETIWRAVDEAAWAERNPAPAPADPVTVEEPVEHTVEVSVAVDAPADSVSESEMTAAPVVTTEGEPSA